MYFEKCIKTLQLLRIFEISGLTISKLGLLSQAQISPHFECRRMHFTTENSATWQQRLIRTCTGRYYHQPPARKDTHRYDINSVKKFLKNFEMHFAFNKLESAITYNFTAIRCITK